MDQLFCSSANCKPLRMVDARTTGNWVPIASSFVYISPSSSASAFHILRLNQIVPRLSHSVDYLRASPPQPPTSECDAAKPCR